MSANIIDLTDEPPKKKTKSKQDSSVQQQIDVIIANLSEKHSMFPNFKIEKEYSKPILIGSRAAKIQLGKNFRACDSSDYDIIIAPHHLSNWFKEFRDSVKSVKELESKIVCELHDGIILEFELTEKALGRKRKEGKAFEKSNRLLYNNPGNLKVSTFPPSSECYVASVETLYELKRSHIYWPIGNWDKHIQDLHALKKKLKKSYTPSEFFKQRLTESEAKYGKSKVNLNVTNEEFFRNRLAYPRYFEHDDLHEIVKYGSEPIYATLKTDPKKALISKSLFDKCSMDIKLKCVREEAMAIALERFIIPGFVHDSQIAYSMALRKVCTTLTKGWFREFAIDHYPELQKVDKDLLKIYKQVLEPKLKTQVKPLPLPKKKKFQKNWMEALSKDAMHNICAFLTASDILNISYCNKKLYNELHNDKQLWTMLTMVQFNIDCKDTSLEKCKEYFIIRSFHKQRNEHEYANPITAFRELSYYLVAIPLNIHENLKENKYLGQDEFQLVDQLQENALKDLEYSMTLVREQFGRMKVLRQTLYNQTFIKKYPSALVKNTVIINAKGLNGKSKIRDITAAIFHPKKPRFIILNMHEFYNFYYQYELTITMKTAVKQTVLKCSAYGGYKGDSWGEFDSKFETFSVKNMYEELGLDVSEPQFVSYIFDLLFTPCTVDKKLAIRSFGDDLRGDFFTNTDLAQCWEQDVREEADKAWVERNKKSGNKLYKPVQDFGY